MLKNMATLAKS